MPSILSEQPVALVVKLATETAHKNVEDLLLPKLTALKSPADYAAILKMFYGFFHPLEALVKQFITPSVLPDIQLRRTADFVLDDLRSLGCDVSSIPVATSLPHIKNAAQAFGALYVMEGSTLGGKMIAKMLAKNEALQLPPQALHFFSGYKENTGHMWTGFLAGLNKQDASEEVINSANETFLQLKIWMQQAL